MATITSDMKVGEIVRNWPQTMQVFRSHGLNLQCGGTHSVAFAAGKHEFELDTFLAELNAAVSTAVFPKPADISTIGTEKSS
jgi:iron-sulfur cluster repair protein YtfE (RIC family)